LSPFLTGLYIAPNNGVYRNGELEFLAKDSTNPTKFWPSFGDFGASNWLDLDSNLLYVLVKGGEPIEIHVAPVVQVTTFNFCCFFLFCFFAPSWAFYKIFGD